jgi:hypothetical protein
MINRKFIQMLKSSVAAIAHVMYMSHDKQFVVTSDQKGLVRQESFNDGWT